MRPLQCKLKAWCQVFKLLMLWCHAISWPFDCVLSLSVCDIWYSLSLPVFHINAQWTIFWFNQGEIFAGRQSVFCSDCWVKDFSPGQTHQAPSTLATTLVYSTVFLLKEPAYIFQKKTVKQTWGGSWLQNPQELPGYWLCSVTRVIYVKEKQISRATLRSMLDLPMWEECWVAWLSTLLPSVAKINKMLLLWNLNMNTEWITEYGVINMKI